MSKTPAKDAILLGTIALEPQRWTTRTPSIRGSEVLPWARRVGFDGLELWGPHYADAGQEERAALARAAGDIVVYSGYARMDAEGEEARLAEVEAALALLPRHLKFNLGKDPSSFDGEVDAVLRLLDVLPDSTALLCECHPGTIVDTPAAAARAFARWPEDRLLAIVHPLNLTPNELDRWFEVLGPRIVHAHLQTRTKDGVFLSLTEDKDRLCQRVEQMRGLGFNGSWTIEFVKGTRTHNDRLPYLMEQAAADHAALSAVLGKEAAAQR